MGMGGGKKTGDSCHRETIVTVREERQRENDGKKCHRWIKYHNPDKKKV
jgi:hypothetical protein